MCRNAVISKLNGNMKFNLSLTKWIKCIVAVEGGIDGKNVKKAKVSNKIDVMC